MNIFTVLAAPAIAGMVCSVIHASANYLRLAVPHYYTVMLGQARCIAQYSLVLAIRLLPWPFWPYYYTGIHQVRVVVSHRDGRPEAISSTAVPVRFLGTWVSLKDAKRVVNQYPSRYLRWVWAVVSDSSGNARNVVCAMWPGSHAGLALAQAAIKAPPELPGHTVRLTLAGGSSRTTYGSATPCVHMAPWLAGALDIHGEPLLISALDPSKTLQRQLLKSFVAATIPMEIKGIWAGPEQYIPL